MKIIRPLEINDSTFISSNAPEADYPIWNGTDTYNLNDVRMIVTGGVHNVYRSLQASNTNHNPLDDPQGDASNPPVWWVLLGQTNRWKMFDGAVNSQTAMADVIDVVVKPVGRVDSIAVLNVSGATIRIIKTDVIDGVVYDETFSLVSNSGITDPYAYSFEPIVRLTDFSVTGLPLYSNSTIQIIVSDPGHVAKIGAVVMGFSKEIGATQYGMSLGITDYSVKQRNDYGDYVILERAFSRNADVTLQVPASLVDQVYLMLSSFRATPCVYIAADEYGSSIIYGFFRDFSVNITYKLVSICTLSLESLT